MPRPVNLSLELLRTFTTLVSTQGDALEAARRLGINQPSMSKRLRYLQHAGDVLEHPWVQRQGRSWQLTPAGQQVLPAVEEIVRRYEQLARFVSEPKKPHARPVNLACGQLAATGLVRDAAQRFRREFPESRLRISTPRGSQRIRGVAMGSYDLALVAQEHEIIRRIARRRLHVETLGTEHLALVCAESAPWAEEVKALRGKVGPAVLRRFPLILPEPDSALRRKLDQIFKEEEILDKLDIVMEVASRKAILEHVRVGSGVGILSDAAVRGASDLAVQPLDPKRFPSTVTRLICRYQLARPEELDLSEPAAAFRRMLLEAAKTPAPARPEGSAHSSRASAPGQRRKQQIQEGKKREGNEHDAAAHLSSR
jgi:DNA-binding transcriptional LysR family regulator